MEVEREGRSGKRSCTVCWGAVVLSRSETLTVTFCWAALPKFRSVTVALRVAKGSARLSNGRPHADSRIGNQSLAYGSTTSSSAKSLVGRARVLERLKNPNVRLTASSKAACVCSHENSNPQNTVRKVELLTATATDASA